MASYEGETYYLHNSKDSSLKSFITERNGKVTDSIEQAVSEDLITFVCLRADLPTFKHELQGKPLSNLFITPDYFKDEKDLDPNDFSINLPFSGYFKVIGNDKKEVEELIQLYGGKILAPNKKGRMEFNLVCAKEDIKVESHFYQNYIQDCLGIHEKDLLVKFLNNWASSSSEPDEEPEDDEENEDEEKDEKKK